MTLDWVCGSPCGVWLGGAKISGIGSSLMTMFSFTSSLISISIGSIKLGTGGAVTSTMAAGGGGGLGLLARIGGTTGITGVGEDEPDLIGAEVTASGGTVEAVGLVLSEKISSLSNSTEQALV